MECNMRDIREMSDFRGPGFSQFCSEIDAADTVVAKISSPIVVVFITRCCSPFELAALSRRPAIDNRELFLIARRFRPAKSDRVSPAAWASVRVRARILIPVGSERDRELNVS